MSRKIEDLDPQFRGLAELHLQRCALVGLKTIVTYTRRTNQEQARLFRQGRPLQEIELKAHELEHEWGRPDLAALLMDVGPQHGLRIVTKAGPGQSLHNYDMAIDVHPMIEGRFINERKTAKEIAAWNLLRAVGVWTGLVPGPVWDWPHMQAPGVAWRELIRAPS